MTWQRLNFLFGFVASAASEAVTWHPHGNLRRVRIPSRESRTTMQGRRSTDCLRDPSMKLQVEIGDLVSPVAPTDHGSRCHRGNVERK